MDRSQEVAVGFTVSEQHFSTREEALAEIAARGWHAGEYQVPAEESELHWHDFDSVAFVLEGTSRTIFEDGRVMECGAGARIEQPARVPHRAASPAYRAVFGFPEPPDSMSRPINKPMAELGDAPSAP
jgi:hypothetical protein